MSESAVYPGYEASAMTVRKGYVDAGTGQVHYRYSGTRGGDEPIVFLHQNTSSSDMFVEAMEALGDDRYVVAPDTPGAGMSYDPDDVPGIGYYADVLAEALDGVGIDEFHLCGHHTGASIAAEMAVADPDRVASVTFSGPPYLSQAERESYREAFDSEEAVPPLDEAGEYLLYHWNNHASVSGVGTLDIRHRQVLDALLAREGIGQVYDVIWDQDFQRLFEAIEVPRMALCARDDTLWEAFERLRADHPEVRAIELEGADYEPLLDTEAFVAAVRSFVGD